MERWVRVSSGVLFLIVSCTPALAAPTGAGISYELENLGADRWRCLYTVENLARPDSIEEFTIWFEQGLYSDLTAETPEPLAGQWDEQVYQPFDQDPIASFDGYYDAIALQAGIAATETVGPFVLTFTWLGDDVPEPQKYEIIDQVSFATLESGMTVHVPEPASWLTFTAGYLLLRKRRK